ncbi:hypothetical protein JRQ81_002467 [Phrynocephalus forsythii]|uniref:DDE Tnp4 domain-containing protein n=1 Tax=Phrynocephalus forsythii TaxID=171643 RepID=A0A9Q1AWH9_9SAUR|nr:hypothetical protein JRQ81_002467 [Phrynocephalus forsythii]
MTPSRKRCCLKSVLRKQSLLASVFENVNIILNCISLLKPQRESEDEDGDCSEFHSSTNTLFQTVFWAVAEWRLTSPRQKLCWCYPGHLRWFHDTVLQLWDNGQWIMNFRMTRQTLFEIADVLRPYLMRRDTVMRSAVPVEERVAIGVYYLASRSCYRTIAHVFQKGTSTIASVVVEVCLAIEHTLLKQEVRVMDFSKMLSSTRKHGFPHCIGAVDGCHVPITPPKKEVLAYFNRKSFHSILLQAACDGDGIFFSMIAGHSGVNHDAHVFRSSLLFQKMEEGTLIPGNPMFQYGGVSIPPLILGDGAYPLRNPYAVPKNDRERQYNKVFNRMRNIVERAFGRLKVRFRRLSVRMEAHIENVNSIIVSAVTLHDICEKKKHFIPDNDTELQISPPTADLLDLSVMEPARGGSDRAEAEAIRTAIAEYIFTHVK